MFNVQKITDGFFGIVGIRQNDNPEFEKLDQKLLYTGSNVLIHHPLLSIENIDMCSTDYSSYEYDLWSNIVNYTIGQRVKYLTVVYEATNNNVNSQPDLLNDWKVVNHTSLYLEDVFRSSFTDVINSLFSNKKVNKQTKTLLANVQLYNGTGSINDLIINNGSLVGLEITLKRNQNILTVINRIGLQLSLPQQLPIYLYHTSQYTPIATLNINHTSQISFQWHNADFRLNYLSDSNDAGGKFYLMYDQDDLTGQAIRKKINFDVRPCGTCGNDYKSYDMYSKFVMIRAVKLDQSKRNGINLWELEDITYTPDINYGLNIDLTVRCDLTDFILQQKDVFAIAVRDMIIFKILQVLSLSTRDNIVEKKINQIARAEIQDTRIGGMGLLQKLEKEMKAIDFEVSELDNVCMPCNNKYGIRHGVAGLAW